jgi:glycosyltransferase involved in cell wall biosynthesis
MRPLKIALLSRYYWQENQFHYEEGGVTRQLAETVAALGHEVIVLSQSSEVLKLRQIELGHLETWVCPRERHRNLVTAVRDRLARKHYAYPKVHSDVRALCEFLHRRGPFDVLWAHSESPDGLVAALAAQRGTKLPPTLLQVQNLRCRYQKGEPVFIDKRPLNLAFRAAKRILAVSSMVAGHVTQYASASLPVDELRAKVHVVHANIQRSFLRAAAEPSLSVPMKDRILYLGALNQHKGVLVFLNALPKTELSKRNGTFAVVGDYTEYNKPFIAHLEHVKETTRKQLTGARVEYLNRVSAFEVLRQIKLAHAVVIPSLYDPFSRGLIEALMLGRPVITTDRVGMSRLVSGSGCGILVPPNDSDALAHAIDAILSPIVPFAAKAQHIGPILAHEFSPEVIALQMEKHLSEIAVQNASHK